MREDHARIVTVHRVPVAVQVEPQFPVAFEPPERRRRNHEVTPVQPDKIAKLIHDLAARAAILLREVASGVLRKVGRTAARELQEVFIATADDEHAGLLGQPLADRPAGAGHDREVLNAAGDLV